MVTVKLKSIYPDVEEDMEITVPDEVFQTIVEADRAEMRYWRNVFRHKAYYSLDRGDGIEAAVTEKPLSPPDVIERDKDGAEYNLLIKELYTAITSLPEKQAKRVYGHYFLGMKFTEIAQVEGVDESAVRRSIQKAVKGLKKAMEKD